MTLPNKLPELSSRKESIGEMVDILIEEARKNPEKVGDLLEMSRVYPEVGLGMFRRGVVLKINTKNNTGTIHLPEDLSDK